MQQLELFYVIFIILALMKNIISIFLIVLILLSGLHLSVATHYCSGELADIKVSFTGQKGSCGMAGEKDNSPLINGFKSHCCDNILNTFSVDQNYTPSCSIVNIISQKIIHIFTIPVMHGITDFLNAHSLQTILIPQDIFRTNAVSLAFICIFRK